MDTIKAYYYLTKPGIIQSNLVATLAGFLFACAWNIDIALLVATLVGVAFIIASACVTNNYIDRDIDSRMKRTKKRAIVSGKISGRNALIFAAVTGLIGFYAISLTNMLTLLLGITAFIMYVFVYGYFKRKSVHGTLVGSISGSLPPVAGYTAVTGQLDLAAVIIFFILTAWQMAHFYAIAMFRHDDYKKAGIPVLPVVKGMKAAKRQIVIYLVLLALIAPLLTVLGYAGVLYAIIVLATILGWLYLGMRNNGLSDEKWARKMFFYSLGSLLVLCIAIATASIVP